MFLNDQWGGLNLEENNFEKKIFLAISGDDKSDVNDELTYKYIALLFPFQLIPLFFCGEL